jgi:hypothetical protein
LSPIWWSFRIRNTSGGWATIQRLSVAVRGPQGNNLDVPCANGEGVNLTPGQEWTCDARLTSGYGQSGRFTFWADWQGYDGRWHTGELSGTGVLYVV